MPWRRVVAGERPVRAVVEVRVHGEIEVRVQGEDIQECKDAASSLLAQARSGPQPARCDFLLVTAVPIEFTAAIRRIFRATSLPPSDHDVRRYYEATVRTKGGSYHLRLFCIGSAGGVDAAAAVKDAMAACPPRYVLMFGIAAIQPGGERKQGSILVADRLVSIPEVRVTPQAPLPRPNDIPPVEQQFVNHVREGFGGRLGKSLHVGVVISQPNLSASAKYRDGLVRHVEKYTSRKGSVVGLEMDAGGVAAAIKSQPAHARPGYMVVKGGVDWGNYQKKKTRQQGTALRVARFVRDFLASGPVPPTSAQSSPTRHRLRSALGTLNRRNRDRATLERILIDLPSTVLDEFFEAASADMITFRALQAWEGFSRAVVAGDFHLFDRQLEARVLSFRKSWAKTLSFWRRFEPLPHGRAYKFTETWGEAWTPESHRSWSKDYRSFHFWARRAHQDYRSLFDYLKRRYAEVDLHKINRRVMADVRRAEMAEQRRLRALQSERSSRRNQRR